MLLFWLIFADKKFCYNNRLMKRNRLIKKLAILYGIKAEYFDLEGNLKKVKIKDCENYIKALGLYTENTTLLEETLNNLEKSQWERLIPPVKVYKSSENKTIKIRMPSFVLDKEIFWKLEKESGEIIEGSFIPKTFSILSYKILRQEKKSFYEIEFPLNFDIEIGYHKFHIWAEGINGTDMDFIVAPEKCYVPKSLNKEIVSGIKINLHTITSKTNFFIADSGNLKQIIKKVSQKGDGIVGIGAVNSINITDKNFFDAYYPSSKLMFSTFYLDTKEMINFIEDKSLEVKLLSEDFQQKYKQLTKNTDIDYFEIIEFKNRIYKILYQSFRENHIIPNTQKARDFYHYIKTSGEKFIKLAAFEAIKEHLKREGCEFKSWQEWSNHFKYPDSDAVNNFIIKNKELVEFYQFLQWQSDLQFSQAGILSFEKKLKVGIYTDLPLSSSPFGADVWLNQDCYAFSASRHSNKDSLPICTPYKPNKFIETRYSYIRETLRTNMRHSGALKICDISSLNLSKWFVSNDSEGFFVEYPFDDILGIVALESIRNNCLVIAETSDISSIKVKESLKNCNIFDEEVFKLKKISDNKSFYKYFSSSSENLYQITKIPRATYRLQFNENFTFQEAKRIIPYLKLLGISHCYSSPLLCARSGSLHGYDIIDHNRFYPKIGSKEDFYEFSDELHRNGMGLILDIVPNHMGIGKENIWWTDVLENGQTSEFSSYFDIDWTPHKKELQGKVLVPILGKQYGKVLEDGELKLEFFRESGKIKLYYHEHEFPINPSSYPMILGYRLVVLESRLGSGNADFMEYQSIITALSGLPSHREIDGEKIKLRKREKDISLNRLKNLCQHNSVIENFIEENLKDFEHTNENSLARELMHNLLEVQAYRLAYWRVSIDEINYRRFFDVNDLTGLCVENPAVFKSTHSFILDLIEQKKVDGLRIDHPDGLLEPTDYFKILQKEIASRLKIDFDTEEENLLSSEKLPMYVVVEKILAPFEKLPKNWAVHGTVGYDFLNTLGGLYIEGKNEKVFTKIYNRFTGSNIDYQNLVIKSKRLIMKTCLGGELSVLANKLNKISESNYLSRDYTLNKLRDALMLIIANFPVYRTYISKEYKDSKDIDYIKWAIGAAKKQSSVVETSIFDFIEQILTLKLEKDKESSIYNDILNFTMKFQQYTGPLMAKGLEDTTFYIYNRLISLNEVGGEPRNFGIDVEDFHNFNLERIEKNPHNMLSTSTHDTKRSEDVRARISVLSEIPNIWQKRINRFSQLNKLKKTKIDEVLCPTKNDEYFFYQTLIGIWQEDESIEITISRLQDYMIKAVREAKVMTSWMNINEKYEEALKSFIKRVLTSPQKHPFWREFLPFAKAVSEAGEINSLSQTLLKLTSPGVPDIYQGCEVFNYSLVDPDNRRSIDFSNLQNILFENLTEKNTKLYLTQKCLNFRKEKEFIFKQGNYIPLTVTGKYKDKIIAFLRKYKDEAFITIAPRLVYNLFDPYTNQLSKDIWEDTGVNLPENFIFETAKDILNEIEIKQNSNIKISSIFKKLPLSLIYFNEINK